MSSKSEILARIRKRLPPSAPLPDLSGPWITFADREQQFTEVLASVGGQCLTASSSAELEQHVRQLPPAASAKQIVSLVPELPLGNFDVHAIDDPHQVAGVDLAVLPAEFSVAENGAVWVRGETVKHRALYFLTQHLVLVVPRREIVDNLQQAYERLQFPGSGYGLWISGPSKTADIEQSLVIGAHGPRSLTVILYGE